MDSSDENLVLAARGGDVRAFEELVRRYYEVVLHRAGRILGNADDARDVTQEVFLRALQRLDQLRDGTTVRAWLGTIGVRLAMNRARRDRFRQMLSFDGAPEKECSSKVQTDPFEKASRLRDAARVEKEIGRLSPAQRTAFHLRHAEQMPFREVAQWMGNSEATARVLYFQAIRRLRRSLEEEG
jgi:RNA polymerase sigma-70 factor (ECF subfamily)